MLSSLTAKNSAHGSRSMPSPGSKKIANFLSNPLAPKWQRDSLNSEYQLAHLLDSFTRSEDPRARIVAEAGLKLHDAVEAGNLSSPNACVAMEQVQLALQAGLPSGPIASVLAQVGVKGLQAVWDKIGNNTIDSGNQQPSTVARSFLKSIVMVDNGYFPLEIQANALARNVDHELSSAVVLTSALQCATASDNWSKPKATAAVAAQP